VLCHYLLTSKIKEQTAAVQRGLAAVIPEPLLGAMRLCISADELDVFIAGQPTIDLDDWQQHAEYKDGYTAESEQVVWFWQIMRSSLRGGCGEGGGGSSSSGVGSSSSSSDGGSSSSSGGGSSSSGGGSSSSSGGGSSSSGGGVGSGDDSSQRVLVQTLEFATGSAAVGPGGFAALQGYNGALHPFTIKCVASASVEGLPKAQTCFNTLLLPLYTSREVIEAKLRLAVSASTRGA
jgi:hypothetical protein